MAEPGVGDGAGVDGAAPAGEGGALDTCSAAYQLLSKARQLVPSALDKARASKGFAARWKTIESKIEHLPDCLSDLSRHPSFSRNDIFREQLQSVCGTLAEVIELSRRHGDGAGQPCVGKLQMQNTLDSLSGKLDMDLRDCRLLIKTGVLGESTLRPRTSAPKPAEPDEAHSNVGELLARLQIGHAEARHRAVDGLLAAMKDDDKFVAGALSRRSVSALIHLLMAPTSPRIREKAAEVIRLLIELGFCEELLVSEGVLPPLIRLAESGSSASRENAVASLQRLSRSPDTARCIVGHGGVSQLVEICQTGDSVTQAAAAAALRNLSAVPEVRQALVEEDVIRVMIHLLSHGMVSSCKEHAAECLQSLTASNESLRRAVLAEGGLRSLLLYLDGRPSPPESAVGALKNLVGTAGSVPPEVLISMGLLPRLLHAMRAGSAGAQQAAASAICKISTSSETKKSIGAEAGCLPLLISMLDAKTNGAREVAAQALSSLMSYSQNAREVRKDVKSVPNLVQLLENSPHNTAKKYAVSCLATLSTSKRCRKLMISHGAVGYLRNLSEMDIVGSKRLLERLERGKLRSLLSRRQLKQEVKYCMQELPHCSVVLMKRSHAKVLRLNLGGAAPLQKIQPPVPTFTLAAPAARAEQLSDKHRLLEEEKAQHHRLKHSTPRSSSQEEEALSSFLREDRASSSSSSTATGGSSSFFVCEQNPLYEGLRGAILRSKEGGAAESFGSPVSGTNPWLKYCQTGDYRDDHSSSADDLKRLQSTAPSSHPYWSPPSSTHSGRHVYGAPTNQVYVNSPLSPSIAEEPDLSFMATRSQLQEKFVVEPDVLQESVLAGWIAPQHEDIGGDYGYKLSDVRDAVSLFGSSPSNCWVPNTNGSIHHVL